MKKSFIILFLGLIAAKPGFTQKAGVLENAYKHRSLKELQFFFDDWARKIKPVTDAEMVGMNDTIKQAYAVFNTFYRPFDIGKIGGSEWGNTLYQKSKYLIIQNKVDINFNPKLYFTDAERDSFIVKQINASSMPDSVKKKLLTKKDGKWSTMVIEEFDPNNFGLFTGSSRDTDRFAFTIKNFRPVINGNGRKPLFLTSAYEALLSSFLKNKYSPLGTGGIMNPARARGGSAKRQKFLENFIKIWQGHWGGYWQLHSYPTINAITFDKDLRYARVDFQMIYEGGQAMLKKEGNKWVVMWAKRTWIE
jgi:hypothetical protein